MLSPADNQLLTQTGPGTPMGALFRCFWQPFLLSEEIAAPDCDPVRVRLLGEDLVAFRDTDGRPALLGAHCPHRRAPLFFGRNEEGGLRCVYHGWKFDLAGRCLAMPNVNPDHDYKAKIRHLAYPCAEKGGIVWTYMGPPECRPERLPDLEFIDVPDSHRFLTKYRLECNYMQGMEGDLDSSHLSFLHANIDPATHVIKYAGSDTAPRFTVGDTDGGLVVGARREVSPTTVYWRTTHWLFPSYTLLNMEPRKARSTGSRLCNVRVPIDDENHWSIRVKWTMDEPMSAVERVEYAAGGGLFAEQIDGYRMKANKSNDYLIDRQMQRTRNYTGIVSIPTEDAAMVEGMNPICDRTEEHLGMSDIAIIRTRRRLLQAARDLQNGIAPHAAAHPEAYRVHPSTEVRERDAALYDGAQEATMEELAAE